MEAQTKKRNVTTVAMRLEAITKQIEAMNTPLNKEAVLAVIAKEIKLRHKAPVIHIAVVDGKSRVLPEPLEVQNERAKAADYSGPHHTVVICSEEQLKVSRSHQ